jgi:hypothetical protein
MWLRWLDARHVKAHRSILLLFQAFLNDDRPWVSLGPVRVLDAQLPTRGIPWLSRSRASPRPVLWVRCVRGTASERITNVELILPKFDSS